jgi:tetratricopeptide (TPR) repeat protein
MRLLQKTNRHNRRAFRLISLAIVYICFTLLTLSVNAQNQALQSINELLKIINKPFNKLHEDTLRAYIKRQLTEKKQAGSPENTILIVEKVLAKLAAHAPESAVSELYAHLTEAYEQQITQNKKKFPQIEAKYKRLIYAAYRPCLKARFYASLGTLAGTAGKYADAKTYLELSIRTAIANTCDKDFIAYQYAEIGLSVYEKISDYKSALIYKLKALAFADSVGLSPQVRAFFTEQVALLHYRNQHYTQAGELWEKMLKIVEKAPRCDRQLTNTYNSIGLTNRQNKHFAQAELYFRKAIQEAEYQQDTVWIGIAKGNIGISYVMQGKFAKAVDLLKEDIALCLRYKEYLNATGSLNSLGDAYYGLGNYTLARQCYDSSLYYADRESFLVNRYNPQAYLRLGERSYLGLSKVFEKKRDSIKAYEYLKRYQAIRDTLIAIKDKHNIGVLQAQYEFKQREKQKEAALRQQKAWLLLLALLLVGLLAGIFVLWQNYRLQRRKQALELENSYLLNEAEVERNAQLQEVIALNERELTIKALQMHEKNQALIEIKKELEKTEGLDRKIEKVIDYGINLEADWEDFKRHFEEVHPRFFQSLQTSFPKLTANDLRHLAYIRLGLDNKYIAAMMNLSPNSLKVIRTRLRKKLGISSEMDLGRFLTGV